MSGDFLTWRWRSFEALGLMELYDMLQLRSEVFVVEQACAFQDLDGADQQAWHLLGTAEAASALPAAGGSGALLAYARCLPPGLKFAEASIGRVITRGALRGTGAGHQLMREAIARLTGQWGAQPIRIGAQSRLEAFYGQHGFVRASEPYLEDDIPHIEMLRS